MKFQQFILLSGGCGFFLSKLLIFIMFSSLVRASSQPAMSRRIGISTATNRRNTCLAWINRRSVAFETRNKNTACQGRQFAHSANTLGRRPLYAQQFIGRLFSSQTEEEQPGGIFAGSDVTFESMGIRSKVLLDRIKALGHERPTAVQAATFEALSAVPRTDMTIGAETGSG